MTFQSIDIRDKHLALIVVDMQRKYAADRMEGPVRAIVPVINEASALFRRHGRPVVLVRMEGVGHGIPEGLEDPDGFVDGLFTDPGDIIVDKTRMNAFFGTGLGEELRSRGVDGVVVCGVVAKWCVHATYFGAFEADLCPYLLKGGSASFDPEHVVHVEALCKTVSMDDLLANPGLTERAHFKCPSYGMRYEGLRGL